MFAKASSVATSTCQPVAPASATQLKAGRCVAVMNAPSAGALIALNTKLRTALQPDSLPAASSAEARHQYCPNEGSGVLAKAYELVVTVAFATKLLNPASPDTW